MHIRLLAAFLALSVLSSSPNHAEARNDTRVKGYVKKGGKYVRPHKRTSPNKSKLDNYGARGNINPNNGKIGTEESFEPKRTSNTNSHK